ELVKRDAGLKKEMTSLRGGIDSVRERSVGLDERQRKVLNVVRSESQASRERLAEMVANQRNLWEGLDGAADDVSPIETGGQESNSNDSHVPTVVEAFDVIESRDRR